jgi:SepF-like predicted cell division protein (DUF552 family)
MLLEISVTRNVIDGTLSGTPVTETAYFPGTEETINLTNYTGTSTDGFPSTLFDILFSTHNETLDVLFRNVNMSSLNRTLGMDLLPNVTDPYIVQYGVNSSYNFTNAEVKVSYASASYSNEGNLHVYVCDNWDFANRTCDSSFTEITTKYQNTTGDYFAFNVTEFSGFAVREITPTSTGSGSGSSRTIKDLTVIPVEPEVPVECSEEWYCHDWSECGENTTRTRECVELNACNTTVYKPIESEACEVPEVVVIEEPTTEVPLSFGAYGIPLKTYLGILAIITTLVLFLVMYVEQRRRVVIDEDAKVFATTTETILVPAEFMEMASKMIDDVLSKKPTSRFWKARYNKYPPLVVRAVRLAILEESTNLKDKQLNVTHLTYQTSDYHYIGYKTFLMMVRGLARQKILGVDAHKIEQKSTPLSTIVRFKKKNETIVNEGDELLIREVAVDPEKVPVHTMEIAFLKDVKNVIEVLRQGPGVIIVDIEMIKQNNVDDARKAIKMLKRTASATNGGVLGVGENMVIVTNDVAVMKQYQNKKNGGEN